MTNEFIMIKFLYSFSYIVLPFKVASKDDIGKAVNVISHFKMDCKQA